MNDLDYLKIILNWRIDELENSILDKIRAYPPSEDEIKKEFDFIRKELGLIKR